MTNIFILGSKGIPAKYGGFETFVEKLTAKRATNSIKYHVACMAEDEAEFEHNGARCFNIRVPNVGSAKAVLYDLLSLQKSISYIKKNKLQNCIIYLLTCRIGPFMGYYKSSMEELGIKFYVNPDGHEWKRAKWNRLIRAYWRYSEKLTVKHADLLICDSEGIEEYIKQEYSRYNPLTTFIAYGADVKASGLGADSEPLKAWYRKFGIKCNEYYLIVGRFVPENNYETVLKEFMATKTNKSLVIICNVERNKFYDELRKVTGFEKDKRIKFVGTVYDEELLKAIRENAFAYFHGHEVGGTNPSLLEALASTKLNLLYDVVFNREVGRNSALYFNKEKGNLAGLISRVEKYTKEQIEEYGLKAKKRIQIAYSWRDIVDKYETLLSKDNPAVYIPIMNTQTKFGKPSKQAG